MSDTSLLQAMLAAKAVGGGGSGFTPTTEQLAAMNSGITAEDVTQIGTNETNISMIEEQIGKKYPSYWQPVIDAKIPVIRENNIKCGLGCSFIFITDTHITESPCYSPYIAAEIKNQTNNKLLILGGDVLVKAHTKAEAVTLSSSYINNLTTLFDDIRFCVGNHDYNTYAMDGSIDNTYALTDAEVYALFDKNFENNVTITPTNLYYSWDDKTQKIRYVVFNSKLNGNFTDQFPWFNSLVQSCPEGYKVIIFTHIIYSDLNFVKTSYAEKLVILCDAINNKESVQVDGTTYDFTNVKANVICIMCGHTHADHGEYTDTGIPIICTANDGWRHQTGNTNEHAFDCINVNFTERKIYCTRIGYGSDREYTYGLSSSNLFNVNRAASSTFTDDISKYMNGGYPNSTTVSPINAEISILNSILLVKAISAGCGAGFLVEVEPSTTYTLSFATDKTSSGTYLGYNTITADLTFGTFQGVSTKEFTFTTNADTKYAYFVFRCPPNDGTVEYTDIMLNKGDTALPYEPYYYF